MPDNQTVTFSGGLVTSRDPSTLNPGELQVATGCEYRVGSPHLHKLSGRSRVAVGLGSPVLAIHRLQYNSAADTLIASAGGVIYESLVSTTPSFSTSGVVDLSTTAVPVFTAFNDSWIMTNGVDVNYIRESGNVTTAGWGKGAWRPLGMRRPSRTLGVSLLSSLGSAAQRPTASVDDGSGVWVQKELAYDAPPGGENTFAFGYADGGTGNGQVIYTHSTGGTQDVATKRELQMDLWLEGRNLTASVKATLTVDVSENYTAATPTYTQIYTSQFPYHPGLPISRRTRISHQLTDGVTMDKIAVRIKITTTGFTAGGPESVSVRVYDVRTQDSGVTGQTTTEALYYAYTERYWDSDGVLHESVLSAPTEVPAFSDKKGAELTLPGAMENTFATEYGIYRTLEGESYPNFYLEKVVPRLGSRESSLLVRDLFDTSLISAADKDTILELLTALLPDGNTLQFEFADPPPIAAHTVEFQGSMVYIPANDDRLFYSLPTTVSAVGAEQVPSAYFLTFQSGTNDEIISAVKTNGGRALVVYFASYTMLVLTLPQATDPGVFDTRITEYVSTVRGCAGRLAATEITMPSGQTLSVAVDALGVWATDGVTNVVDWSRDLNWDSLMTGVVLSEIELVENPAKRRLELLYSQGGKRKELHFFYGRMKQDNDGNAVPLITGPHPTGVQCKHFSNVSGAWIGWSGDATATGDVFIEGANTADASAGYDGAGNVPFVAQTGDFYVGGLGRAVLWGFGYPKFESGSKSVTLTGNFRRDGASVARTKQKTYTIGADKKVYWHTYADRHSLTVSDITGTALPGLVGYEIEIRDAGVGRDQ